MNTVMLHKPMLMLLLTSAVLLAEDGEPRKTDFRLLSTQKTSTMEKEMNEAASNGYRFSAVMGGQTAFGGKETVVVMSREKGDNRGPVRYKLLAANRTSTLQKELNEAGREAFEFKGVTVFESSFGGREVAVILERAANDPQRWSYRLLATSKTSTMDKELNEAGEEGFRLEGMAVGKTAFGDNEVVSILSRLEAQ